MSCPNLEEGTPVIPKRRSISTSGRSKLKAFLNRSALIVAELSDSFWSTLLPQEMDTSASASPYFLTDRAAYAGMPSRLRAGGGSAFLSLLPGCVTPGAPLQKKDELI